MCQEDLKKDDFNKLINGAFRLIYIYRDKLIAEEEYEEVIAIDKLIVYVKLHLFP